MRTLNEFLASLRPRVAMIGAALIGAAATVPAGAQDDAGWTTYRHPTGAFIEHPQNWRVQPTQVGIALVPPDFDPNAELIVALGESAAGLRGPTDPQIGQYFDLLMSQIAPAMRRRAGSRAVEYRGGAGALYEYRGTLNTGQAAQAQFRTAILGGNAIAIALVATDDKLRQREPVVQRIFSSLGQGEPQRDPALVGSWQTSSTESDSSSSGSVFFRTDSVYTLMPDGRLSSRSRSQSNVTGAAGGTAASSREEQSAGSWSAAQGRLFITWDDGTTSSGSYEVSGDVATVRMDGASSALRLNRTR